MQQLLSIVMSQAEALRSQAETLRATTVAQQQALQLATSLAKQIEDPHRRQQAQEQLQQIGQFPSLAGALPDSGQSALTMPLTAVNRKDPVQQRHEELQAYRHQELMLQMQRPPAGSKPQRKSWLQRLGRRTQSDGGETWAAAAAPAHLPGSEPLVASLNGGGLVGGVQL